MNLGRLESTRMVGTVVEIHAEKQSDWMLDFEVRDRK
jgi:hypothetical protein